MSYCRWSDPVPELTPEVDVSFQKIIELYKEGGVELCEQYKKDNGVITSDAYVYESICGFECHWTSNVGMESKCFESAYEMATYLQFWKDHGVNIPQASIDVLFDESKEEDEQASTPQE